jgi:hypothetical protein
VKLPLWFRPLAALALAYVAILTIAGLGMSATWRSWDWRILSRVTNERPPRFSPRVVVLDIENYDARAPENDRLVAANFLRELLQRGQKPAAVVFDFSFGQETGSAAVVKATSRFSDSLDKARQRGIPVYATVSSRPMVEEGFGPVDWSPLKDLAWAAVYDHLSGIGHTMLSSYQDGLFYQVCYPAVPKFDSAGNVAGAIDLEALPELAVSAAEGRSDGPCDPSAMKIVTIGSQASFKGQTSAISPAHPYPARRSLDGSYAIVASVTHDVDPLLAPRSNPELLAWAFSDLLTSAETSFYKPAPLGDTLLALIFVFSLVTIGLFMAAFLWFRRMRLGRWRLAAPWLAAGAAALGTLALFFGVETLLLVMKQIQPQVSFVSLAVVVTAGLSGVRGRQILIEHLSAVDVHPEESHDYDVFISYAHEEFAWVRDTVYRPLRDARLADGRALRIFFDTESIKVGASWQQRISLAIDGSTFVVPVYSDIYFSRAYCRFEIRRALRKWIARGEASRCVLPVMRGHPKIDPSVDDIQAVSVDDDPEVVSDIVHEIVARIGGEKPALAE